MMGHTHMVIGAAAGLAVAAVTGGPDPAFLIGAAAGAALLPDIDHPQSGIRQRLGIAGHVALFWVKHRGITHSLAMLALVAVAAWYLAPGPLAVAITAGYASHLLADCLTITGLPLLLPVSDRTIHLLPSPLRIRTGSVIETMILALVAAAVSWGIYAYLG